MKFLVSFLLLVICLASVVKATEEKEEHSGAPKEKRGVFAYAPAVVRVPVAHTVVRVPYYPPVIAHSFHPPPSVRVTSFGYHQVHPGYAYAYYG